jgi:hypothetical protein
VALSRLQRKAFAEALAKVFFVGIGAVVCFIPLWVYLAARWLLAPQGFWQEFFLLGVGMWILGTFQIAGVILFVLWAWIVLDD